MAPSASYNEYWQLDTYQRTTGNDLRYSLERKGYEIKKSAAKPELIILKHQSDCGRLCYDRCTEAELLRFIRDRQVSAKTTKKWSVIISELVAADNERTFTRFLDLPPELRNRIYQYYIADFAKTLTLPARPPLALISKQLEKEVLPLFYSTKTFHLIFERKSLSYTKAENLFKPTDKTTLFLLTMSKENLADIRRLVITMRRWWRKSAGDKDGSDFCTIHIKLDDSKAGFVLKLVNKGMDCDGGERNFRLSMLRGEISKVLQHVAARKGTKKLRIEDVYALRKAMEITYNASYTST